MPKRTGTAFRCVPARNEPWLNVSTAWYTMRLIRVKKDWKDVLMQKMVTLNLFIFSLIPWPFILSYSMLYFFLVLICVTRPCNVPRHVTARYKSSFYYYYYYYYYYYLL